MRTYLIILLSALILLAGCKPQGVATADSAELLAGSVTPYKEFTQAEYEQALGEGKTVVLYFYSNWCPTCEAEQADTEAAFAELDDPNIIGFRVNYKDSETSELEESLAREFGISYQHTKVVIKDGERVLKAPDTWTKERYLEELSDI